MIIIGKFGVGGDLAGQKARRQRHAHDDADILRLRLLEEQVMRALAEDVVDDLDGRDARILDRLQRFLDIGDRDAVVADLALDGQIVQRAEHVRR